MTYEDSLFNKELGDSLSPPKSYKDIAIHAYLYKQLLPKFAEKLYLYEQKNLLNTDLVDQLMKNVYKPKAKTFLTKRFHESCDRLLDNNFYIYLKTNATYTEIEYLSYFLSKDKIPKLRKPRAVLNKIDKLEFEFIRNTSTFTRYEKGVRLKRKRGYDHLCEWCKEKLQLDEAIKIKTDKDHIFICPKHKVDTIRTNFKRHGFLKPRK